MQKEISKLNRCAHH